MSYDNSPLLVERNERGFWVRAEQIDRGKSTLGMGYTLAQSGVAVPLTGTVAETPFASVTVPGGLMGPNGALRLFALYSMTGSVNAKTIRAKLGTFDCMAAQTITAAAVVTATKLRMIHNRGSESAQIAFGGWAELATNTAGNLNGIIDTTQDVTFTLTGQLASAAELLTLEAWTLEVLPG